MRERAVRPQQKRGPLDGAPIGTMPKKYESFDWTRLNLDPPEAANWDETLLLQFRGQCYNVRSNFLLKMMLLQDLNQGRELSGTIEFAGPTPDSVMTFNLSQFNAILATPRHRIIRIRETIVDMCRGLIGDTWAMYERLAIAAPAVAARRPLPEFTGAKGGAERFLQMLGKSLESEERWLLDFFERARNCLIHYDGRYARHIRFDDTFYGQRFQSEGNSGKPLPLFPPIALALHTEVHRSHLARIFERAVHGRPRSGEGARGSGPAESVQSTSSVRRRFH